MKTIYYILYDPKILKKRYKTEILYYSDNFESVIDKQEQVYPKSHLFIYESETSNMKTVGLIKCHNQTCKKYFIIVDNVLTPAFPFCSKICAAVDLYDLLEAGKEDKVDDTEYDNIEGDNI